MTPAEMLRLADEAEARARWPRNDAAFVAAARADVPALADALREAVASAEKADKVAQEFARCLSAASDRANHADRIAVAERALRVALDGWDGPCVEHVDERDRNCPACHVDADVNAAGDALRALGVEP